MKKITALLTALALIASMCACSTAAPPENPGMEISGNSQEFENKIEEIERENIIDDSEALSIARELVARYNTYNSTGIACDLVNDYSEEDERAILNLLSEDQRGYYAYALKSTCCKTYDEAKQQLENYIDSSLLSHINDDYVVYNNDLYFIMGGMGTASYQDVSLDEFGQEKIVASAEMYIGNDYYIGTCQFTIENRGQNYIITDAVEHEESVEAIDKDPVTILLEWADHGVNLAFSISAQLDSGGEAVWRDHTLYDQNGTALAVIETGVGKQKLTISNHNAKYSVTVEDADWSPENIVWNTIGEAGARITIQKGTATVANEDLALYRSYTGYWFGGVCEVDHGTIKEYDSSWINY